MQTKKTNKIKLSKEQQAQYDALTTTAAKVRFVNANITSDRGEIARLVSELEQREVRYQWVRNVLITPLKKAS
jgi:hypothetical protein